MTNNPLHNKISLKGFLITLIGAVFFSTKAIFVKVAFREVKTDALTLLTLRMFFSLPFYLAAAFFTSRKLNNIKMNQKQWITVVLIGMLGYYISSLFDFIGLQYISAGLERLILFLYPTFAVLINAYFFKQKLTLSQKIALLLTYIGIGIAYFGELKIDNQNAHFFFGSFMVFLCAFTFSIYLSVSGKIIPIIGATKFTAYAMLSATLGIFLHFAFAGNTHTLNTGGGLWMYGILIALIATVIPSFMMSNGLKQIGSNNVAIISSIGPVSTIIQAHFILGEPLFAAQLIGTALVIIGVMLIGWKREVEV